MPSGLLKLFCILCLVPLSVLAEPAPKVGRAAAAKYFQKNGGQTADRNTASENSSVESSGSGDRYLAFGLGTFTKSESYSWGVNKEEDVGKWSVDMNYRLSQYNSLLDYSLRVSYQEYEPAGQKANKLIFLYAASLPDADSRFPLYFGAAAGAGVFMTQIPNESSLTFDYQVYLGMRLFDVLENTGFYLEGGLKNHLQMTSDGQFNGTFFSAGAVFTF